MSSNMKNTIMETFQKFGGLGVNKNSQELFVTQVLNDFYDNGLINDEVYEESFIEEEVTKKEPKKDTSGQFDGAPPRGVGPVPVEERPVTATAELIEEEVVEAVPETTKEKPKKEKKSKTKSKKKFGWLGE